jgi:hypothetical protein
MIHYFPVLCIFAFLYIRLTAVSAYGFLGHYVIGEVVYLTLSNESREYIHECGYLQSFNGSLGLASVWADVIKRKPKYKWTRRLHYYDIDNDPPNDCGIFLPPKKDRSLNLYNGVQRALVNATTTCDNKHCCASVFYSNMLWHLLQDFFQPLHLTGKARGGNRVTIVIGDRHYNLHRFWDSIILDMLFTDKLGSDYTENTVINYIYGEISTLSFPEKRCEFRDATAETVNDYVFNKGQSNLNVNCNLIWNFETSDYVERAKETVKQLLIDSIITMNCVIESLAWASEDRRNHV